MTGVSVIVPVHNDTGAMQQLLPQLLAQTAITQIIICASAKDEVLNAMQQDRRVLLTTTQAGRGHQLNHGASMASHNALWFVHADATVNADCARYIKQRVAHGDDGGWFRFQFAGDRTPARRRLAALISWRARHGIAYGDQGLFFSRDAFNAAGGFAPTPLFEEVALVRTVKSARRFHESHLSIGVNPRRWQQSGWIRRTVVNRALALGHAAGIPAQTLARWYRRR